MLRHYFIAALRSMAANRLQSAIAIVGLAVGIAAALIMALVIRSEVSRDHFLPGYARIYTVVTHNQLELSLVDAVRLDNASSDPRIAPLLRLNVPQVEAAVNVVSESSKVAAGRIADWEGIGWADPGFFSVLRVPVLYGDPVAALSRPDGVVIPRTISRKYFGRQDSIGRTLTIDGHPMIVRAVIEDVPLNASRLENGIYASSLAPFAFYTTHPPEKEGFMLAGQTYVRLRPGVTAAAVQAPLQRLLNTIAAKAGNGARLLRLDQAYVDVDLGTEGRARLAVGTMIALLILFIAVTNFVNLTLARAVRRGREIGIRKACGADRNALIVQFMGEALLVTVLAAVIAATLAEWLLPFANIYLHAGATPDYWRDPPVVAAFYMEILVVALTVGVYPALVLSGFGPLPALKGWTQRVRGTSVLRNGLIALQFAVMSMLAIAALVVLQQYDYAVSQALRLDVDQVLVVKGGCRAAFRDQVRQLAGVKAASCVGSAFVDGLAITIHPYKGRPLTLHQVQVDPEFFAFYRQWPLAGTTWPRSPSDNNGPGLVINRAAVQVLGFASPQAALGHTVWQEAPWTGRKIIAVVPDFALNNFLDMGSGNRLDQPVQPTIFVGFGNGFYPPNRRDELHIRLDRQRIPKTLGSIDRLWSSTGGDVMINRFFLDAHMQERYVSVLRQAEMIGLFAGVAIFLACLGLFGIAVSTAERRTKEIGIRKAMGADDRQIVALLLWQFAQPVLWANVIAWPVAWWAMHRWLAGFAYHVELQWWVFAAASLGALLIALVTVAGQSWLAARQKPVLALRYE